MGRFIGSLVAAAVLAAPSIVIAQPAWPAPPSIAAILVASIFGETSSPSLALRTSSDEKPLREIAFQVSPLPKQQIVAAPIIHVAALPLGSMLPAHPSNILSIDTHRASFPRFKSRVPRSFVTAEYQPEPLVQNGETGDTGVASLFELPQRTSLFDFALQNGASPAPLTMRVGKFQLQADIGADATLSAADSNADEFLPPFVAPFESVNRSGLNASLSVPVAPRLLLGFGYDTEELLGGYQSPGITGLDAQNNTYSGRLTFLLPRFSSALSLSAQQYRYQDNVFPSDAYTQLRESLNLTIQF
jgi:hypothetical protein